MDLPELPIGDVLPEVVSALQRQGCAVLQAPPGAGKTTVVPLALLAAGLTDKRIIMLEPRRLAARAAAQQMADTLAEPLGKTVGYRIRGERKISAATRIEVVTEGILTRMIQNQPELPGVGIVIFDEFHERSLNADLGLALVWESRAALRPDLCVLVMSATLDAKPVAEMLGAPVITSAGRAYDVETHWLSRPAPANKRIEVLTADLVIEAAGKTKGGMLVFLPGESEIRRVQSLLQGQLGKDHHLRPLFGAMEFKAQRAAVEPAKTGRKIVLATSIAETSLTIPDIETVVDAGLSRRVRFDPGSGMSRLVTEPVSKAEAEQRRGRAGRLGPGQCYRAWTKGQAGALPAYAPAEIETADLTSLVLDLAQWGARSTQDMAFLTLPNPGTFANARALLRDLNAIGADDAISPYGRRLAEMPLHPRLAHMLCQGGPDAPLLAALLSGRDPMRNAPADLLLRLAELKRHTGLKSSPAIQRVRRDAKQLTRHNNASANNDWAALAAMAYPDRIGSRRPGDAPKWILSGGKEASLSADDPLANASLIVATDLDGNPRSAKIRQAIEIPQNTVRRVHADRIKWTQSCDWSNRLGRIQAVERESLGACVLQERKWNDPPEHRLIEAAVTGVREVGLTYSAPVKRFISRVELLRKSGEDLPSMQNAALIGDLDAWLKPYLSGVRSSDDIRKLDLLEPLKSRLDWQQLQRLDQLAPASFKTPLGRSTPISYDTGHPEISVRLQEMFGQSTHPMVAGVPLRLTLLSPAHRPVQTTTDLPGFWANSYAEVRKEMRGRYPKHPWPENPAANAPTLRAKPRGSS